jgi:hypothetical protein
MARGLDWDYIVQHAAQIVRSYDTGVTLRQLFYRLVSDETIPNNQNAYKGLSRYTARARREGWFPDLVDRNRSIEEPLTFTSAAEAVAWVKARYRRDRTEGQDYAIYLGVEKAGIVEQLIDWFWPLGLRILPLGGYSSQSFVKQVVEHADDDGRETLLIYAGDFDASGEDIDRDFVERTDVWDDVQRIALNPAQIAQYNLPPLPGKASDSRAAGFVRRHGSLMQVELDALPPDILRGLFQDAIDAVWDDAAYQTSIARERKERDSIKAA